MKTSIRNNQNLNSNLKRINIGQVSLNPQHNLVIYNRQGVIKIRCNHKNKLIKSLVEKYIANLKQRLFELIVYSLKIFNQI